MDLTRTDVRILSIRCISRGCKEKSRGNYKRAFEQFLKASQINPEVREEIIKELTSVLCILGRELEDANDYSELFTCYKSALSVFGENDILLNNLGAHLLRLQQPLEASVCFRRAYLANPSSLSAFRNLETANNALIPQWHFRMLNDSSRNSAYCNALARRIGQGHNTVLDIGTGTGILSLFAVRGGARTVYACDCSPVMVKLAENVVRANRAADKIKIIPKLSNDLLIPDDIPSKVSLAVTETMDAGLFGERILESLIHAKESLLTPDAIVIPASASIRATLVQSDFLSRKRNMFHFQNNQRQKLDKLLSLSILDYKSVMEEPYDTEILPTLPGGFSTLSDPMDVLAVDFNNVDDMKETLSGKEAEVLFPCSKSGHLDAVVFWFNVNLCDDISLSNSPFVPESCWDQAVVHLDGRFLETGTVIKVSFFFQEGFLTASVEQSETGLDFPEKSMRYLNTFSRLYEGAEELGGTGRLKVLDACRVPIGGLHLAKTVDAEVTWISRHESLLALVQELAKRNDTEFRCLRNVPNEISADVVFHDIINSRGEMSEEGVLALANFRHLVGPNSLFIPSKISIVCQLISSPSLRKWHEVDDSALEGCRVALFINPYKVYHVFDVNTRVMGKALSERLCVATLSVDELISDSLSVHEKDVVAAEDGVIDGVQYWFEWSVLSSEFSSWEENPFAGPVVEMVGPIRVKKGDLVKIKMSYQLGILRFTLDE